MKNQQEKMDAMRNEFENVKINVEKIVDICEYTKTQACASVMYLHLVLEAVVEIVERINGTDILNCLSSTQSCDYLGQNLGLPSTKYCSKSLIQKNIYYHDVFPSHLRQNKYFLIPRISIDQKFQYR